MRKTHFSLIVAAIMAVTTCVLAADPIDKKNDPDDNRSFNDAMADILQRESKEPAYVPTPDQIEVQINESLEPDRVFFDELTAQLQSHSELRTMRKIFAENHSVGRIDLNGDGKKELVVYSSQEGLCGSAPECTVFIYHHDGQRWRYVGDINSIHGSVAYFEQTQHNGWRTYKSSFQPSAEPLDGYPDIYSKEDLSWSVCWTTPEEINTYYKKNNLTFDDDGPIKSSGYGLGRIIDPSIGGYLNLSGNELCWEK